MPRKRIFLTIVAFWTATLLCAVHAQQGTTYTTAFPLTENPLSESGHWIGGGSVGLDWSNFRTTPGFAFGTQSGLIAYNDSIAVQTGTWGPNQTATATVRTTNRVSSGDSAAVFEEVELLLHFSISAHRAAGYEATFSVSPNNRYVQVNRWNGAFGSFTLLYSTGGPPINDGDTIKATINGSTITLYVNNTQVVQVNDSMFPSGNPGIGHYYSVSGNRPYSPGDYGLTSFTAFDSGAPQAPPPPTNVKIIK